VYKVLFLQTREAKHPPAQKSIVFKVRGQHPPTTDLTVGAHPWVPPLNKNSKSLLFPHLQQHRFENPEYGVYFRKSYPSKEKILKDMLAGGSQGKAIQESKTLFAEILTNSGSLKIQFYYQVKSLPAARVLSTLVQALGLY
jgi:hypothetical protein